MNVASLTEALRLQDPTFFADPHDVFARFRREAPVFWYEPLQCWALFKHEHIKEVLRATDDYSVESGILIGDNLQPERLAAGWPPGGEPLLIIDPPRHKQLRLIISKAFTPKMVAGLEGAIRDRVDAALSPLSKGDDIDFIEAFAKPIPAHMMIELLKVPHERESDFVRWTDAMIQFLSNPDPSAAFQADELIEFWGWLMETITERRENPGDDLISQLIAAEIDGESLSEMNLVTFCVLLLVGGLETSRNLAGGAAQALFEHPDQRALLVEQPAAIDTAIDEFLRWTTPAVATARTAKVDTEIEGRSISKGDYLIMLFQSANRDEAAFASADCFDVTRRADAAHMSFGWGTHLCLGAALARLEIRVMFEEFLRRFPDYEITGKGKRLESLLMSGFTDLPMRLG